jgi:hypothetical protein
MPEAARRERKNNMAKKSGKKLSTKKMPKVENLTRSTIKR